MQKPPQDPESQLFAIAESQQGYFTSKQAKACGYQDSMHSYHMRTGAWQRAYRGIYRLTKFPLTERPDLMIWALWSCNRKGEIQGVYSHQTALALYQLSDILPDKVHMTVPPGFRRNSAIPSVLTLHKNILQKEEKIALNGYFVTTPYRTLLDIIAESAISHDLIIQAIQTAYRSGLLSRVKITHLLNEPILQNSPILPYLQDI